MNLTEAAKTLDVAENVLTRFDVPDGFNPGNTIGGFLCQQSDHRYGALVIDTVNDIELAEPQVIYCTPKLHYPFGETADGMERRYHWPKAISRVEVYEKLDGCFEYHTPILLADGSKIPIGQIVNQDLRPLVWSYNETSKEVVAKQVTAVHKYPATKPQVKMTYKKVKWQRGSTTLICTADHRFITPTGTREAGQLQPGSLVYRFCPGIPQVMHQFLVGCLLGDACIRLPSKDKEGHHVGNPDIEFGHGDAQKEYLDIKYRLLQAYARKAPEKRRGGFSDTVKWAFSTKSHQAFVRLFEMFIELGEKTVPKYIQMTPLTLAVWFMDDGSVSWGDQRPRASFHTECFTQGKVEDLLSLLQRTYYLDGHVHDYGKGPILELDANSTEVLFTIVAPYVPKCLQYKIPENLRVPVSYLEQMPPFELETGLREVEIESVEPYTPNGTQTTGSFVYDLTVDETHTYFAGEVLAHNSNICAYTYANASGHRFLTFKTRLTPVVQSSRFGDFAGMWRELMAAKPDLRELLRDSDLLRGGVTLAFEMFGYRNKILVVYEVPLDCRLLFVVEQTNAEPEPGASWWKRRDPELKNSVVLKPEETFTDGRDLTRFYDEKRAEAESRNVKTLADQVEEISGTEGYIFYTWGPSAPPLPVGIPAGKLTTLQGTQQWTWTLWKCLDGRSRVLTENGWERISKLVTTKSMVRVASLDDEGNLVWKPIIGWHRSKLGDRQMVRVGPAHGRTTRSGTFKGINVTEDHPFKVPEGYKAAVVLTSADQIATGEKAPNPAQREVLEGTMLGDAGITHDEFRLRFAHVDSCWSELKASALGSLGCTLAWTDRTNYRAGAKPTRDATFEVGIWSRQMKERWYPEGVKRVPRDLKLTPLLLATWYLDDGGLSSPNAVVFATNGFPKEDVEFLLGLLLDQGYDAVLGPAAGERWVIRLRKAGVLKLAETLGAYIPMGMRRKAPEGSPEFEPRLWALGAPVAGWDRPLKGASTMPQTDHTVYCIDVADTHNFVTAGGVVHNCKPPSVEDLHWVGDFIPESRIIPTCWNALESVPDGVLTVEYIQKMLREEFTGRQVVASFNRIEKSIEYVNTQVMWRAKVMDAYRATGKTFDADGKAEVMRALARGGSFSGPEMKKVFSALVQLGLTPAR